MRVRIPWQLPVAAALLTLLAVLGTLQYRWLGEVSDAERDRMRAAMRSRASDVAQQFNAQLTRVFIAFHVDPAAFDGDPAGTIADAFTRWRSSTSTPGLVRDIYIVERAGVQPVGVRRFIADRGALEDAVLPAELAASLSRTPPQPVIPDAVDARVPAIVIAMPRVQRTEVGRGQVAFYANGADAMRLIAVQLDPVRLRQDVLEPLITKAFGDRDTDDVVTVVQRDAPSTVVFNTGPQPIDARAADVSMPLFDLRIDEVTRLVDHAGLPPSPAPKERFAITIVRRANGGAALAEAGGAWDLRVRHRLGSLDEVVARSRRRNITVALGVLALLGASIVLIIAAAQRQQRLARQQLQFVAAVSHDLRTPLAVICSAGENLADGVVADTSQVKRYGALIQTEGKRLHDMVERVMAFAGITSGAPMHHRRDVDLERVVRDAVASAEADARDRGVALRLRGDGHVAPIAGDADALRSAVQNVIDNAIKYSPCGATVDVSIDQTSGGTTISVSDRGLGIDATDLEHVFQPFYRGRRAIESQVRGSGIGLSVVRHVVDAHEGRVTVASAAGSGTTVTITLPPGPHHDEPAPRTARAGEVRA